MLSACGQALPGTPTPTLTKVPTESPTSTATPLPINTNIPEPTPTEVVKQYAICDVDHWKDCYVPIEELGEGGDYLAWLEQSWNPELPTPNADKQKIVGQEQKTIMLFMGVNDKAIPVAERPYSIGFTAGYTKCGVTWDSVSHEMTCAIVPIAMSVPGKPGETKIVIGLIEVGYNSSDTDIARMIESFHGDHIMMLAGYKQDPETRQVVLDGIDTIDVMQETIENYPDIMERVQKFRKTLDPSFISGKGLLFTLHLM